MASLYEDTEPYNKGFLKVSDVHTIYYEECGNKDGIPAIFLHGGPGCGIEPRDRRYWDPKVYRIILFDQRGSGQSTPFLCLENNTTWDIVEDMEKLRKELNVEKWQLLGGSWGSTLGLAYAQKHPERVSSLVIQGIFLCTESQSEWYHQKGANYLFPDYWDRLIDGIPENEHNSILDAYYKRMTSGEEEERLKWARKWAAWESSTLRLHPDLDLIRRAETEDWALALGLIEIHYLKHNCFLTHPNQLLDGTNIIVDHKIPTTIINGRYDVICPLKSAWELYKRIPHADFFIVDDAGHLAEEVNIAIKLKEACDKYKFELKEQK